MSGFRRISSSRSEFGFRDLLLTTTALVAAVTLGGKDTAAGQLSGLQVQAGQATLSNPSATSTLINQTTSKAILNWQSFSIAGGTSVQFKQPGAGSIALNRVLGGNVSNIAGQLSANGQVWIVNPSGVFFGAGAQVNVGGLLATTADIQNSDFLAGNYKFGIPSGNPNAAIINQGNIQTASGGSVVFAGAHVSNEGLIQADLGTVALGGGKTFAIDFQGDKLLSFQVTAPVDQTPANADGTPIGALVSNSGKISANGGTVLLTARAAKNVIDNVINSSGIIEAKTASMVNGEIVLDGGNTGEVVVTGSLDASGKGAGETGGTVKVLGNQVVLADGAVVDASGDAGGGTVLVGGNFHGAGPEQNAATTIITAGATINADAITTGNGGQVAVWSDQFTEFLGTISVNGGSVSGNGGMVETSSASFLNANGTVSAVAPNGTAGTWLLDPDNLVIVPGSQIDTRDDITITTTTLSDGTVLKTYTATADGDADDLNGAAVLGANVIGTALSGGSNVVIQTAGNIDVNASITETGTKGVTLSFAANTAAGSSGTITLAENVSILGTNGALSVSLLTGNGGSSSIILGSGSEIDTHGGSVFFDRRVQLGMTDGVSSGVVTINATGPSSPGSIDFASTVDAAAGRSIGLVLDGGAISFGGSAGAITALASLQVTGSTTSLGGSAYHTTGNETFTGPVLLVANTTLTSDSGNISFVGTQSTINGATTNGAFSLSLFATSSNATVSLGGSVGNSVELASLVVDPTSIVLVGSTYHTTGSQTYSQAVTLGASTSLTSDTGSIVFKKTIDGAQTLTASASAGTIEVDGLIGGTTALAALSFSGNAVTLSGIDHGGNAGVTGTVTVSGASTLDEGTYHSGGTQTYTGPVVLAANTVMTSDSGDLRFVGTQSTIDGNSTETLFSLGLTAALGTGTVSLGGSVGNGVELASLAVDPGSIVLGGAVYHTAGDQTYSQAVTLGASTSLTSDSGSITFLGTIDGTTAGAQSLGATASAGAITIDGLIGHITPLAALTLTGSTVQLNGIDHGGSAGVTGTVTVSGGITLDEGTYHSGGTQTYTGPVVLAANTVMTSDSGDLRFVGTQSTIDGNSTETLFSLGLTAALGTGTVSLGGSVGNGVELASLAVDPGSIILGGAVYHTAGDQTYSQAVTLGASTSLTSDSGSITFLGTIDGTTAGAQSLGATALAGAITIDGLIGGTTPLAALTLDGKTVVLNGIDHAGGAGVTGTVSVTGGNGITLDEGTYHSGGTQTWNGAVALGADTSVTSDLGNVTFTSTIDGAHALSVLAHLGIAVDGLVGGGTALTALTLTGQTVLLSGIDHGGSAGVTGTVTVSGGSTLGEGTYHSGGTQTFTGPVVLTADTTMTSDSGDLRFVGTQSTIDGAHALSLQAATGTVSLGGSVGNTTKLSSLLVDPIGIVLGGAVYHTAGDQTYSQAVTLGASTSLTSDTGSITFKGTIDGTTAGAQSLTATASHAIEVDGLIGNTTSLAALSLSGNTVLLNGIAHGAGAGVTGTVSVTGGNGITLDEGTYHSGGSQTWNGAVALGADTAITSDLGSVTFTSTINGAHALSVLASLGGIAVDGLIGGGTALTTLSLDGQTVTLNGIGTAGNDGVTGTVSVTGGNGITLDEGTYHSGGTQTYTGPVVLAANTVMTSDSGDLRFVGTQSTIDGNSTETLFSLGLTAALGTGTVSLGGSVGNGVELASLAVDPGSIVLGGAVYHTAGDQTYSQAVTLGASTSLTSDTGNITFLGTIDGTTAGAQSLAASAGEGITVDGLIGGATPLAALTLGAPTVHLSGIGGASAGVTGTVSVTGGSGIALAEGTYHSGSDQTYAGPVSLLADTSVTSDLGNVTFTSTIDGAHALSVLAQLGIAVDGLIGGGTALTSLSMDGNTVLLSGIGTAGNDGVTGTVSVTGGNGITLDEGTYHSGGTQTWNGAVALGADTAITSDLGSVTFTSTINGAHALSVLASLGGIAVDGLIGGGTALTTLSLDGQTVTLNGIGTAGNDGVTGTVSVTGGNGITLDEGTYHSGGTQTYTGPVVLAANTVMTSDSGDLRFVGTQSTIDGNSTETLFSLGLTAALGTGTVSLGGSVGNGVELASLAVDPGSIVLGGAAYHTARDQTYSQAVTLGASTSLTSDSGSITFLGTIDGTTAGAQSLGATALAGAITIDGLIGGTTPLAALTLDGKTVVLNGIDHAGGAGVTGTVSVTGGNGITLDEGTYHSGGTQTWNGAVALGADTSVTSDLGNVTFTSTIDGAHALSVLAHLGITVDGLVGGGTALTSLSMDGKTVVLNGIDHAGGAGVTGTVSVTGGNGITLDEGTYHSGGTQTWNGAVALGADTSVTSDLGNVTFTSTIDGAHALSVLAHLGIAVDGLVGGGTALTALTLTGQTVLLSGIDHGGSAGVTGTVTVSGGSTLGEGTYHSGGTQTFTGPVVLTADTTMTSDSGDLRFVGTQSTIDGAHALSLQAATGTVSLGGSVGNTTKLSSLLVDPIGIVLGGAVYHTAGDQTYSQAVTLGASTSLTSDTGSITFKSTIDGGQSLTATAGQAIEVDGVIGSVTPLAALSLSGNTVLLNGIENEGGAGVIGSVSVTGTNGISLNEGTYHSGSDQTYNGAVTLLADTAVTSDSGNVTFTSTINGAHALSVLAGGAIAVDGLIGSGTALTSLSMDGNTVLLSGVGTAGNNGVTGTVSVTGGNGITLDEGTYHSGGTQAYTGPVVLAANTVMTSDSGDLRFVGTQSTIDGNSTETLFSLGLTAALGTGTVSLGGSVGNGVELASLAVDPGSIILGGAVYHTAGDQTYSQAVTLGASTSLTSDSGSITFKSTIDGGQSLTAAAGQTIEVDGLIGGGTALAALSLTGNAVILNGIGGEGAGVIGAVGVTGSAITLNQGTYHSGGTQTYSGAASLGAVTAVTSDNGNVVFTSTVDGAHALSVLASVGKVEIDGAVGGAAPLTSLTATGLTTVTLASVHTNGAQSYTSPAGVTLNGSYGTGNGALTITGPATLAGATTFNSGSGALTVTGALGGSANLTIVDSGTDSFALINLGNVGTLDLSGKTAGSFTAQGSVTAAALLTGSNDYTLSLLGGGTIGDPTLANTGGINLAGSFLFVDGFTTSQSVTLGGATQLNTETSGITLGSVSQGAFEFIVIADSVDILPNSKWSGTGPRGITPFSNLTIGIGDAPGQWTLNQQQLDVLADPPLLVMIGGGSQIAQELNAVLNGQAPFVPASLPGPINLGNFTFNAPVIFEGSSINLNGTITQTVPNTGVGFITPGTISGPGSLNLGSNTGILIVAAGGANLTGVVNGSGGAGAAGNTTLILQLGPGPFIINGVCFAGPACNTGFQIPTGIEGSVGNLLHSGNGNGAPPPDQPGGGGGAGGGEGGLGGISPAAGGDTGTDASVDALTQPLNATTASQAVPKVQGYYVSLLGNLLYEWRQLSRMARGSNVPEENNDFSSWGNEARW